MITISSEKLHLLRNVGYWPGARAMARKEGQVCIHQASGNVRMLYLENGRLRQKTWKACEVQITR